MKCSKCAYTVSEIDDKGCCRSCAIDAFFEKNKIEVKEGKKKLLWSDARWGSALEARSSPCGPVIFTIYLPYVGRHHACDDTGISSVLPGLVKNIALECDDWRDGVEKAEELFDTWLEASGLEVSS